MKRILKAIRTRLLRFLAWLLPIDAKRIRLLSLGFSGSNAEALLERMPMEISGRFDVHLVPPGPSGGLLETLRYVADLGRAKVVVSTHGYTKWNARQRNLELWHGFPLKGMNLMDPTALREGTARRSWKGVDRIASYSALYSSLMAACMGVEGDRFAETGIPRDDLLWGTDGEELLDGILGTPTAGRRVVFYMPTFRRGFRGRVDGRKSSLNVFGFERFDGERFSAFIDAKGIRFVAKLHPFEERVFLSEGSSLPETGVELLTERELEGKGIELYRILARADALVTDYSSVYFDLLLRDIPLLFAPVDLEAYRKSRGFLMEPYERWTPGPKVVDQEGLERELARSLEDPAYYAEEREAMRDIIHANQDDQSSKRVWDLVLELMGD
jgi:CDP-ribitol ribitolphosphotransferase